MPSSALSDKALAVFAFAAYHELSSGESVVDVVLEDQAGHRADPAAVEELETGGFVKRSGARVAFTEEGQAKLSTVITAMRGAS